MSHGTHGTRGTLRLQLAVGYGGIPAYSLYSIGTVYTLTHYLYF